MIHVSDVTFSVTDLDQWYWTISPQINMHAFMYIWVKRVKAKSLKNCTLFCSLGGTSTLQIALEVNLIISLIWHKTVHTQRAAKWTFYLKTNLCYWQRHWSTALVSGPTKLNRKIMWSSKIFEDKNLQGIDLMYNLKSLKPYFPKGSVFLLIIFQSLWLFYKVHIYYFL